MRRHREDDRFDPRHLRVVEVDAVQLAAHARDELHHALERPHLLEHPRRGEKVVEGELPREQPSLHLLLLVLLDRLLGLLDQGQDVAHPEDPGGHPVRVEDLELVELLAHGGELDGLAGDRLHGQRGTPARIAVELREQDAVECDPLLERARDGDRLLARHRVQDEEDVERLDGVAHVGELVHQRLVDLQPAGGVHDHDVAPVGCGAVDALAGGDDGVRGLGAVDGHLQLAPELLELVDGGGSLEVGGDEPRTLLLVLAQVERELRGGGRLAGPLQPAEEHHRRRTSEGEPRVARPHQHGQLVVDDLDDLLARLEALQHVLTERALTDRGDELLDDLEVDVGLEQREADLARRPGDGLLVETAAAAEVAQGVLEPGGERVEHVTQGTARPWIRAAWPP